MQADAIVSMESDGFTVGLGGGSPNANTKDVEYMAFGSQYARTDCERGQDKRKGQTAVVLYRWKEIVLEG